MVKIGYVRVSSADQNEERQIKKMLELGIEERMIFVDKQSGKDFERPGYQTMKRILRKGDLLYLDALGTRNSVHDLSPNYRYQYPEHF
jgi:DNA invertase Pin-like site-specific DNA recombinase